MSDIIKGKFGVIVNKAKKALGLPHDPIIYLDYDTVRKIIMDSDLFRAWYKLYPKANKSNWDWDDKHGLTIKLYKDSENNN